MSITYYADVVQGTEQWHDLRRGLVTASIVKDLVTPSTFKVADNETVRGLLRLLVAERVTGWTDSTFSNFDMERGVMDEPVARAYYSEHHAPVTEVGFVINDDSGHKIGASPDGLVGDDGGIEIKCPRSKEHLRTILADEVPSQYVGQVQANLLTTGRAWWEYVSFCAGMPLYVKRVFPDPQWLEAMTAALASFEERAAQMTSDYLAAIEGLPTTERPDYIEV